MAILTEEKGFFTKKYGPLPMWAWIAIGVGALYVLAKYEERSKTGSSETTSSEANTIARGQLSSEPVYENFVTTINSPRTGSTTGKKSRTTPPIHKGRKKPPFATGNPIIGHRPPHNENPTRKRKTTKKYIIVAPWRAHHQPWNSTLPGIAHREYGSTNPKYVKLLSYANHIANPHEIYPGQRIYIPNLHSKLAKREL